MKGQKEQVDRGRRSRRTLAAAAVVVVAGAFAFSTFFGNDDGVVIEPVATTTTTSADPVSTPPTTQGAPATPTTAVPDQTTVIDTLVPIPQHEELGVETDSGNWSDPIRYDLGSGHLYGAVGGDNLSVYHSVPTGEFIEGCEGGSAPLRQEFVTDLSTGNRTALLDGDSSERRAIIPGPGNQFAVVEYCDANGLLAAVGSVGQAASFLPVGQEAGSVNIGGNTRSNFNWSADGSTLWVNGQEVDAVSGDASPPDYSDPLVQVVLADGRSIVSGLSETGLMSYFTMESGESIDQALAGSPFLLPQTFYPQPAIRLSLNSATATITTGEFEPEEVKSTIVTGTGIFEVKGEAFPSPDGTRLLVVDRTNEDDPRWMVVDLEDGASVVLPDLPTSISRAFWAADGLLLQGAQPDPANETISLDFIRLEE